MDVVSDTVRRCVCMEPGAAIEVTVDEGRGAARGAAGAPPVRHLEVVEGVEFDDTTEARDSVRRGLPVGMPAV